jgi:NADH-quinone oxidoreductase subunit M
MTDSWIIPLLLLVPIGAALALLLPTPRFDDRDTACRFAFGASLITFVLSLLATLGFDWSATRPMWQLTGELAWMPALNLSVSYGVDAISLWLVLLTTFLMPIVVISSLTAVQGRAREYYFWLLMIEAAMLGTFVARDIVFFYVCFEFTLIPLYFLIGVFGSAQRLKAAKVFFLYTFAGSMLTLAGVLYVAWFGSQPDVLGEWTFNIARLYEAAQAMSTTEQAWVLAALLAGFAVKVPLWPVHTWLPLAHTEAPTAGSVILAGVLLKLGTYGLLRFAVPMTPKALAVYAPAIAILAIVGILYTALVCWVQKDVKKLIAYSSVSHLGFCVLGLMALDLGDIGAVGSVMYMVNHGLSTGALFLCVGMIYERFHTREMAQMSGLARVMPVWGFFMVFFVLASVALPGLNGFVGEFLTLLGAFASDQVLGIPYAAVAALGMIVAAIYLLYLVGRVIFGPVHVPEHDHDEQAHAPAHGGHHGVNDLNQREIGVLVPIALACLVLGLYPMPVLNSLEKPVAALTEPAKIEAGVLVREGPADATLTRGDSPRLSIEPLAEPPRLLPGDATDLILTNRSHAAVK